MGDRVVSAALQMATSFPHLDAYVAGLPEGLDSHPEHFAKSALVRSLMNDPLRACVDEVPACLRELVRNPPPASSWVRQTHAHAIAQLARDIAFGSDAEFAAFCYEQQRALFSSSLYRLLMRCTSPSRVLTTVQRRWSAFNRGTSVVAMISGSAGRLCIEHPTGLFDPITRIAVSEALRATLDLSRASEPKVALGRCTPSRTEIHAEW